jgi:hypothetical protein
MKRTLLYSVDRDGVVHPVFSALVSSKSRQRVILPAHWVESVGVGLLVVGLFVLPSLLFAFLEFIVGGSN